MLSKLRHAFTGSNSSIASNHPASDSNTITVNSKRARSSTIPSPGSTDNSVASFKAIDASTLSHSQGSSSSSSFPRVPQPHNHDKTTPTPTHSAHTATTLNSLILDSSRDRQESVSSSGNTSSNGAAAASSASSVSLSSSLLPTINSTSSPSSPSSFSASSDDNSATAAAANYTPLATPRSMNFPNVPFSTPATPPRVAVLSSSHSASSTSTPQARQSPHYSGNTSGDFDSNPEVYRSQDSSSNSPLNQLSKENYNSSKLPVPDANPVTARRKTKSTATLPAWLMSSFSSSSSSSSSSSFSLSSASASSPASTSGRKEGSSSKDSSSDKPSLSDHGRSLSPSLAGKGAPIAHPASNLALRLDNSARRGSLPSSSLSPESAATFRPRSPSVQMHIQTISNSQRIVSGHAISATSTITPATTTASSSSSCSSATPPSPHTPVRLDRSPFSSNAPSPLSTTSSPYQFLDSSQSSSPNDTTETRNISPSSPANPARRKSILGKRRNFTEVWNGSASTSSSITIPAGRDESPNTLSENTDNCKNKKKGSRKWNRKNKDTSYVSDEVSNDRYPTSPSSSSSLLSTSKKIFSKSVDDLSSFTKNSFHHLSSSPINYSRPRKSIDERNRIIRGVDCTDTLMYNTGLSGCTGDGNTGFSYAMLAAGLRNKREGDNENDEEELEDLSSGSSTSLALSPIPSAKSSASIHSLASLRLNNDDTKKSERNFSHSHNQHHIYTVPKLPSLPNTLKATSTGQCKDSRRKKGNEKSHYKALSSTQVQLPPSISLPGGLCIDSTASILASSMDATEPEISSLPSSQKSPSTSISNKRKSMDSRSIKPENISSSSLGISPGLAPAFDISPTLPKSAPPIPTSAHTSQSVTSSFPMRPSLTSRKSSGSTSIRSAKSSGTARLPSFGSPKASPGALPPSPQIHVTSDLPAAGRQRSSQIILMEGFLQRKTDHRSHTKPSSSWSFPFSSPSTSSGHSMFSNFSSSSSSTTNGTSHKVQGSPRQRPMLGNRRISEANIREIDLAKGWKPFYAILRGTNLYLYKIPNDMNWQVRSCFSNYTGMKSLSTTATSLSSSSSSNRLLANYTASTPLQSTSAMNDDKLKASISTQSKATYLLPVANSSLCSTQSACKGDVFELLTEEGELAVLQAASRREADEWKQVLSNTGISIANRRASYLEAIGRLDLGDSVEPHASRTANTQGKISESSTSSASKGSSQVFGVSLESIIAREEGKIPKIAELLFKEVEGRGLFETGIYRVPGENRVMQEMKAKLDAGQALDLEGNASYSDPHNLASLTKLWLRELPEVIPATFYSSFINADAVEGYDERLCAIRDLIWRLPAPSFHLLDRLCEHLHLVAEHELENQMHAPNLAIVFAPTILRPPEGSDSYALLMSNLGRAAKLVASLIVQHHWIFSGQEVEEDGEAEVGPDGQTEVLGNTTVKSTAESGTVHQAESSMDSSATDDAASNEVRAA